MVACPTGSQDEPCVVDCRYKWGDLQGSCNQAGDSQTRKPVCPTAPSPTPDYSTVPPPCAPLQPLNGGQACPSVEILTCGIKPCVFEWDDWSGKYSKRRCEQM